ncbi:MAG: FKBP-type peptidyl-prolyl cis-trans isomerase [Bacteroidales bacterium]|nr:FKBP-type peptidyl-prolyl cis-trans isomerase [Bacteroidales bacterium]
MEIKPGKFVAVTYKLWGLQPGEEPEEIEETQPGNPLTFVYGTGLMLESFEKKLENLKQGDKFDFVLTADEAYGEVEPENIIELPKDVFFVDGKFDDEMVVEGAVLPMRDQQGNTINGTVEKITNDAVTMDFNHPMAGTDLHFVGEVVEVREPNEDDIHACSGNCCGDADGEGGCGEGGCNGCH